MSKKVIKWVIAGYVALLILATLVPIVNAAQTIVAHINDTITMERPPHHRPPHGPHHGVHHQGKPKAISTCQ